MVHDPAADVRRLVARESWAEHDKPAVVGLLQRVCRAAARDLPATGVGVSVLSDRGDLMTAAASSATSVLVEELQFTLGEGPCIAAYESRSPVLVPDLSALASTTWPGYAPAAHRHGVRAVFAFPLLVGGSRIGALDVYRDQTGDLMEPAFSRALAFAEVAMQGLVEAGQSLEGVTSLLSDGPGTRLEVYQAQGMVMVQLGVRPDEALGRLRAYAYAHERRLSDVADDVIGRRLQMESDGP
ncbi:MAG: GAF and ANTAR domain-containing protein [Nocardioides sp.]